MLEPFFKADTVAIIGASREADKVGHTIMQNFTEGDFEGELVPVNPKADEILGYDSYKSVTEYDGQIDHAVVAVPPSVAHTVVQDCVDASIPAVTVVTAGFSEIGSDGEQREEELKSIVEGTDTRILGPNCLGVWDPQTGIDTLFLPDFKLGRPPEGSIALISQSGAVGSSMIDMAADRDIGFSKFVSYGNQADVTETELISYLADDPETEAVAVYMEGAADGEKFREAAEAISEDIPIIILKAGKSKSGSSAAESHTGSLAGRYQVYQGVFKQTGVAEAQTTEQLFDIAKMLAYEPPIAGNNIAVVTNGGGYGVISADSIEEQGRELASFSNETTQKLNEVLPDYASAHNPLDVIGDADSERYKKAMSIIAEDPNVDAVIALALLQPETMDSDIIDTMSEFAEQQDIPIAVCMVGGEYTDIHMKTLEHNEVPVFQTPERAIRAMDSLLTYGEWLENR